MSQKKWYQMTSEETMEAQNMQTLLGLTSSEAEKRLEQNGKNELSDGPKLSPITLFLGQFKDFMVLVLVGATLISGLLGEYLDAITIVAIIIMNGILGFIQEYRAERSYGR